MNAPKKMPKLDRRITDLRTLGPALSASPKAASVLNVSMVKGGDASRCCGVNERARKLKRVNGHGAANDMTCRGRLRGLNIALV
ncbi:MAG: hypothetical protein AB8G17_03410 [Gammaproteobacteria bacterium]